MNINKYIQTKNLEAMILSDNSVKLSIYNSHHSPYGYDKRDLIVRHISVQPKEFTYDYVSDKVDEVYSTFNKDEIDKLLNKVQQYNDTK